jgi:hypothetical protein
MPFVTQVTSSRTSVITRSSGGKVNISKQGLNSVKNDVVRKNLMGVSDSMKKGDWVDSSGRKGTLLYCPRPLAALSQPTILYVVRSSARLCCAVRYSYDTSN